MAGGGWFFRNTKMIHIDEAKCLKCKACVNDCIVKVLTVGDNGFPRVRPEDERFCLNCQHCLAVCPVGAVECHGVMADQATAIGPLPSSENMMNLLCQRRSIRQYKQEDLDAETMDTLVKSLAWTPTGCNDHRLFFTVVRHREEMDFFRDRMVKSMQFLVKTGIMRLLYPNFKRYMDDIMNGKDIIFRNAPHMVVACTPKNAPCKEADPWIALSYFDLMAQSLGVGTCWCGFAVYAFKWVKALRERLDMPKGYKVGAVLLFGKPAVEYKRQTAPKQFQMKML